MVMKKLKPWSEKVYMLVTAKQNQNKVLVVILVEKQQQQKKNIQP